MSENNKLTPEKLQQLQALQAMLANKQQGAIDGKPKAAKKFALPTPKTIMLGTLQTMQGWVKFIDQFTNLVVNKETDKMNDVVKSARKPILFGAYITIIFVIGGFIWAALAPLDSATVAIGTVISSSKKRDINHQEGGIIKKIYVAVGQQVKKGDPLIEFDDTRIKTQHDLTLNQYRTALAAENRLMAELSGEETVNYDASLLKDRGDPLVEKILKTQDDLFKARKELKNTEIDSLHQKTNQMQKQIEGLEAKKIANQKALEVAKERLDSITKLSKQGYVAKSTMLEQEVKEAAYVSEIANSDVDIAKTQQEVTKTEIELMNVDSKYNNQTLSELKETQGMLSQSRENLHALTDALSRVLVTSPVDGVVNNLHYYTVGSSVQPYQTLVEVSPLDDHLVIEAKVKSKNIDSIYPGLVAKIRFSAFKSRTTPLFTGKLVSISPDIVIDRNQMGGDPELMSGYYLAKIEINMDEFNEVASTRKLELHPGMQAEVQIVTGTRTLLRYLLDPVIDAMFKGFKEK